MATIRPYEESRDRKAFTDVLTLVYRSGEPWKPEDDVVDVDEESAYVAEVDGQVVAGFFIERAELTRGPSKLLAGGIAGVAVRPDARQQGVAGDMMRFALEAMRQKGYLVSHLYAFRESFYRKFGWEVCGSRLKIVCPQHRLPPIHTNLSARLLEPGNWAEIESVYEAFAQRHSGMHLRSPGQWKQVTQGTGGKTRMYAIGSPAEAYAVAHVSNEFWSEQMVSEVAWSTRAGYEALLAFLASIGSNKTAIAWYEPGDSPFIASYVDQGIKASLERPVMYRALEVPGALGALRSTEEGAFTVAIDDREVEANRGPWRVEFSPNGTHVEPTAHADLRMDIRRFAQALMGEPSLRELHDAGLIDGGIDAAEQLLTPMRTYCMDFF